MSQGDPLVAITSSAAPYLSDVPQLLSLPPSFEFRFRYRRTWIEKSLLADIDDPVKREALIEGQSEVLLLFHSLEEAALLPLRRCKLLRIEPLGPIVYVVFAVGDYARTIADAQPGDRDHAARARAALEESCAELVGERLKDPKFQSDPEPPGERGVGEAQAAPLSEQSKRLKRDLREKFPSGAYLRRLPIASSALSKAFDASSDRAWGNLVSALQTVRSLARLPLFHLLGFETEKGTSVESSNLASCGSRRPLRGYKFMERHRYRLRVLQCWDPPKNEELERARVICKHDSSHLELEGHSNVVSGRYDVIEFAFSAKGSGYSEVGISAEPARPQEGTRGPDWEAVLAARVPVRVQRSLLRVSFQWATGIFGAVAFVYGPQFLAWAGLGVGLEPVRFIGAYLMVVGFGDHLERYLKTREAMPKLGPGQGTPTGP